MSSKVGVVDAFEAFQQGDENVFRQIMADNTVKLFNFVKKLVKSNLDAEEIVQDVFLEAWSKRDKIKATGNIEPFLYVCARYKCMHRLRDSIPDSINIDDDLKFKEFTLPDVETQYTTNELSLRIAMIVENLPAQRKIVFSMSRFDGLSRAEIAEKLGIAPSTVSKHLDFALTEIKKILFIIVLLVFILSEKQCFFYC